MTRLALDRMIQHAPIDPILEDVAEEQYDREFLLGHLVPMKPVDRGLPAMS